MPAGFDIDSYDAIEKALAPFAGLPHWKHWARGFSGFAFRYRGAVEANERFCAIVGGTGTRFQEEDCFFAMLTNGVAASECYYFALYCLGAIADETHFGRMSASGMRRITPDVVAESYSKGFPDDELTACIIRSVRSGARAQLVEYRDVLAHRGSLPREYTVDLAPDGIISRKRATGTFVPSQPKKPIKDQGRLALHSGTTEPWLDWLQEDSNSLLNSTLMFCLGRLPRPVA